MTQGIQAEKYSSILDWCAEQLVDIAGSAKLIIEARDNLASATFRGSPNGEKTEIQPVDLPSRVRALKIGRHSVLLGELPPSPSKDSIEDILRRFRNQAVVARSYLTPNEALDLQVFLIGPAGSESNDDWSTLALLIERDEKVARKLAWLRPSDAASDKASFHDFIHKTFLARPWKYDGVFTMADLDSLTRIPELADGSLPRNTAETWVRLTTQHQNDSALLVDALIEAWANRGKS